MQDVVDEIVVVDSYSTDQTQELCQKLRVKFLQNPFGGHIEQKNYAMEQASHDIVLSLDADERLSEEMKRSILEVKSNWQADGYKFNRANNYCGTWLKHAWYPDTKLRLWDRRKGRWGGTNPHDKVIVDGTVKKLDGDILHYAYNKVEEHLDQIRKFAEIDAQAKYNSSKKAYFLQHVILNPAFKFLKMYVFRLGFLDGHYGLVYCTMASYYNFIKYLMLWELNRSGNSDE